jgi:transposase
LILIKASQLLRTIPGVGKTLGLTILYEIGDVGRFLSVGKFISYARLVKCSHESAGKRSKGPNNKIGNTHLTWAFSEAACLFLRECEQAKAWHQNGVGHPERPERVRAIVRMIKEADYPRGC